MAHVRKAPKCELVLVLMFALSACSQTPPPAVEIRTVTVEKPIPVACIKRADRPAEPTTLDQESPGWKSDAQRAADLLAAKAIELRNWGRRLFALTEGCVE